MPSIKPGLTAADPSLKASARRIGENLQKLQASAQDNPAQLLRTLKRLGSDERRDLERWLVSHQQGQLSESEVGQLRDGRVRDQDFTRMLKQLFTELQSQQHKGLDAEVLFQRLVDRGLDIARSREAILARDPEVGKTVLKTMLEAVAGARGLWGSDHAKIFAALVKAGVWSEGELQSLQKLGLMDPAVLLRIGAGADGRMGLGAMLPMSRGRLLLKLSRTELLRIGQGKAGELGLEGDILRALQAMGISSMKQLAKLRGLPREQLELVVARLRNLLSDDAPLGRLLVARDLRHWGREAARLKGNILLRAGDRAAGDIEEEIASWMMEQTFFSEMAFTLGQSATPREKMLALWAEEIEGWDEAVELDARDRQAELLRIDERDDERERRDREEDDERTDEEDPFLLREDPDAAGLVCFWVSEPMWPEQLGRHGIRHLYVCFDPSSGNVVPKGSRIEFIQDAERGVFRIDGVSSAGQSSSLAKKS